MEKEVKRKGKGVRNIKEVKMMSERWCYWVIRNIGGGIEGGNNKFYFFIFRNVELEVFVK